MIVPAVVQQHADDAAALASQRLPLVDGPTPTLLRILRFDRRLASHFEGLKVAGAEGWAMCDAALETPSSGLLFALAVRALEDNDDARLANLFAVAQAVPETAAGLIAAFEWVDRTRLQGTVASLLRSRDGFRRMVGVAACAAHLVDPGVASGTFLRDVHGGVRSHSLRLVGTLGLVDLMPSCFAAMADADEDCRFWSAWSAVLIGDRSRGLDRLIAHAQSPGPHRVPAFRLALQAMTTTAAHGFLQQLAANPQHARWLIQGSGIAGEPAYVPWLLKRMRELPAARLAGEAFSTITGIHLSQVALDQPAPENFEAGPSDDPDDSDVEMDPDDGLPWPDVQKIDKWWAANASRFAPGTRYFAGAPVTRDHCLEVLKNGYQRQRILAAHYLCLLEPGTPLFNTSAPAWRQQRLLAKLA